MKFIKKSLRIIFLVLPIVLASFGLGIGGGIPIPPRNKKEDNPFEIKVELDESKESKVEFVQMEIKQ